MLNAVAAAAAAVNKNSPQLFSKYIESVHKAMTEASGHEDATTAHPTPTKFVAQCRQLFDEPTRAG